LTEEEKEKKRAKARENYQRRKATKGKEIIPDGAQLYHLRKGKQFKVLKKEILQN